MKKDQPFARLSAIWTLVAVGALFAAMFLFGDAMPLQNERLAPEDVVQAQDRADKTLAMMIGLSGVGLTPTLWSWLQRRRRESKATLALVVGICGICIVVELGAWGILSAFRPIAVHLVVVASCAALAAGFVVAQSVEGLLREK